MKLLTGIFWTAVSVLCWGTLFPVVSYLMKRGNIDCYTLVQLRFLIAGCVMICAWLLVKGCDFFRRMTVKDWLGLAIHGVFAAGMSIFLFRAQQMNIPVVNASMLESETPLLIFLLSITVLRNKTSWLQLAGLLLGFAGSLFVLKVICADGFRLTAFSFGDLLVLAGALCWAVYTVLARKQVQKWGGFLYTSWTVFFAGIWTLLYELLVLRSVTYPVQFPDIAGVLYLAFFPTALAFFGWNYAQKFISVGLLAVSGYFTPMLTALFGLICFGEPVTGFQFIGMVIVFGASLMEPEIAEGLRRLGSKR